MAKKLTPEGKALLLQLAALILEVLKAKQPTPPPQARSLKAKPRRKAKR